MKPCKIIGLLLSVLQFLLFLKLIEFVRGDPNQSSNLQVVEIPQTRAERHIFAPQNRKKWRKLSRQNINNETDTATILSTEGLGNTTILHSRMDELTNTSSEKPVKPNSLRERACPVRIFIWEFCPLDIPFVRLLFPASFENRETRNKETFSNSHKPNASNKN